MIKKTCILMLTLATAISGYACDEDGKTGFLPENDLKIGVFDKSRNNMTEARFNEIIDKVDSVYASVVRSEGGRLKWARNWDDGTVNASAQRTFWGTWKVNMYGGLARHPLVTDDGFALVVCHELGHHLGGAPQTGGLFMKWASNEGQSDYFATLKCFRRVFGNDDNQEIVSKMNVPSTVQTKCEEKFTQADEVALCVRSSMAGKSLAELLGSLRGSKNVKFDTPDTKKVSKTFNAHPEAQCRLDTYFQGALCDKRVNEDVSSDDATIGTCNRSEGYNEGVRPLCWYAPQS